MPANSKHDKRSTYLLLSDWQVLSDWRRTIRQSFPDSYGTFLVGSCLYTADYRDVDVRLIMPDEVFDVEFLGAKQIPCPRGKLAQTNTAFSIYASKVTGLLVDFQFQRAEQANKEYPSPEHKRNAIGMKL
ncbi:MAG: hypothetical protein E6I91_01010 [Chloroflexi bacterium]|nr:MAG: hypothetical protein E6I91_01010 [Chloroflexota bacterium]